MSEEGHNRDPSAATPFGPYEWGRPVKRFGVGVPITIQGVISDRSPSDSLRVFIQWAANGSWQSVNLPAGSTTFTFHHTYGQIGRHQVSIQVIDDDLDFDQLRIVLNVVLGRMAFVASEGFG